MARSYAGFRFVKTLNGGPPAMSYYPLVDITAGVKYNEGQVLTLNANGSVARSAAASTEVVGVAGATIDGASIPTTSEGTSKMPVYHLDSNNVFEAIGLASVAPDTVVGNTADLVVGTTNNHRIVVGTAASVGPVKIIGYHPDEAVAAATGGRYWVIGNLTVWSGTSRVAR